MQSINTMRGRRIALAIGMVAILGMILASIPEVEATTKMNPQRPYRSSWGMRGWTYRNNECGTAVCAGESVSLGRSSWRGYRYVSGSANYNVGWGSTAYSRRACRSGSYTYQTRHRQLLASVGSGGITVKGTGISVQYWSTKWLGFRGPRTGRTYRNSTRCENGSLYRYRPRPYRRSAWW